MHRHFVEAAAAARSAANAALGWATRAGLARAGDGEGWRCFVRKLDVHGERMQRGTANTRATPRLFSRIEDGDGFGLVRIDLESVGASVSAHAMLFSGELLRHVQVLVRREAGSQLIYYQDAANWSNLGTHWKNC